MGAGDGWWRRHHTPWFESSPLCSRRATSVTRHPFERSYRNQTQLMDVARGYVDRGLPISVIVIDWQHWVHQGDWTLNPRCWPDPQGMFDELQTLGIELMVTFWPFQSRESTHWQEFSSNGYLVKVRGAHD